MMHGFFLVPADQGFHHIELAEHAEAVRLHDDLVTVLRDTLLFVPMENPAMRGQHHAGLNLYGPTNISLRGSATAAEILQGWCRILRAGPSTLTFTGQFCWLDGADPETGDYERFTFDRDSTVEALERLVVLLGRVDDTMIVRHQGI